MCGLSGWNGITNQDARMMLTLSLASGIDNRGGHAAGYVSVGGGGFRYSRRRGPWLKGRMRFLEGAMINELCMMHARFATCGTHEVDNAHPFAIRRNGRVVLWGAHNGMVPDAFDSAKKHGRPCEVDSHELFELLADNELETLQELCGYGVLTWIHASNPDVVNLARLSDDSEICVCAVEGGGVVWASTWKILETALDDAKLKPKGNTLYQLDDIGRVYQIQKDRVVQTNVTGVKVSSTWKSTYTYGGMQNWWSDSDNDEEWAQWRSQAYAKESKALAASDSVPDTARLNSDDDSADLDAWLKDQEHRLNKGQ